MNIWANSVITQKGLALQAKLIAGTKLTITRAVTGTAYVAPALLMQQTAVGGEMQELTFLPVTYPEEGKCVLPCRLTNEGLTAGYTAMQIGVYADDPDEGEILYFIAQSDSDKGTIIPSETEVIGYSAEWNFYFQYGQADEVSVTVDPSNTVSVAILDEVAAKKADKNLSNVDDSTFFGKAQDTSIFTTGGTGEAYTVELPGVTQLFPGLTFTMIPHVASTTTAPTLNVNGLGAVNLRQRIASTTGATTTGAIETWLSKGIPVTVTYNGTLWMVNHPRTSASYIYGTVDIEQGGTGATDAETARANLGAASSDHDHPYLSAIDGQFVQRYYDCLDKCETLEVLADVDYMHIVKFDSTKNTVATNELVGCWIIINGKRAYVGSNTVDSLTLYTDSTKTRPSAFLCAAGDIIYIVEKVVTSDEMRDSIGAAPAGFGLGTSAKTISSMDLIDGTGTYDWGDGNVSWIINHYKFNDNYAVQIATAVNSIIHGTTRMRLKENGTWGAWEWVTPPMNPGVEYRTTERYNGKAVYASLVNCGVFPESGTANANTGIAATGIVRFHARQGHVSLPIAGDMEINIEHDGGVLVAKLSTVGQRILTYDTSISLYYTKD